jgi:16S rRNA (guanine527-N7)-methyltransferase
MAAENIDLEALLRAGLPAVGVQADQRLVGDFAHFLRLLEKWNRAFNLTAVRDPAEMVPLHILDSLSVREFLHGRRIADIGTGAGLPGIPLAMVEPEREFLLLDSGGKKIRFVQHAIGELQLGNAEAVQARVPAYAPPDGFDTVICRAFSSLPEFAANCAHLVRPGGRLLAMKGRVPQTELGALPPGWQATEIAPVALPGLDVHRHVLVLERSHAGVAQSAGD